MIEKIKIKVEFEIEAVVVELYRGLTVAKDCNGYFHGVFCNQSITSEHDSKDNLKRSIDVWLGEGFEFCEEGAESYWCEETKVWWSPDEFPPEERIRRRKIKQQFGVGRYRLANGQEAKIVSDRGPAGCELLGVVVAEFTDYFENWSRNGKSNIGSDRNLVERIGDL